jgi:transposase
MAPAKPTEGFEPTAREEEAVEMKPKPRLKFINRQQQLLHPIDVERLVEADHPVRAIWELVGRMNLEGYYQSIGAVEGAAGREAFDPQLLISLWIYAYSQKVGSAREIARRCHYDPAYQWLTGLEAVNYHTLSDFRVEHQEGLEALFIQVLGVLSQAGWVGLQRVIHDGTKIKAQAGEGRSPGEPDRPGGAHHGAREKRLCPQLQRADLHRCGGRDYCGGGGQPSGQRWGGTGAGCRAAESYLGEGPPTAGGG